MNEEVIEKAIAKVVGNKTYAKIALDARKGREKKLSELLEKKKLPDDGFLDEIIEEILKYLSSLDSNNFPKTIGVGEREGRIYSNLVKQINFNFAHGVGRSGSLTETQPKAVGSTLLARLTESLLMDLIKISGIHSVQNCILVPMATGMTLTLTFLSIRHLRPTAKFILWSRIDQKSCFKAMHTAGFVPIIIDTQINEGEELQTDVEKFKKIIKEKGPESIACIYSTTSCFAPRACDNLVELAKLSKEFTIPHVVNNAYGLQSTFLTHQIEQATKMGRIDIFVSSADKNLMVPVSGCIVGDFKAENGLTVKAIADNYAGRASSGPALNVFITLLSMGKNGFLALTKERKENVQYLNEKLKEIAENYKEKVFVTKNNPISMAMTLENYDNPTFIGSMLFTRGVSGARVVPKNDTKDICGVQFKNWGSHTSDLEISYLTAAVGIGAKKSEINEFIRKLNEILRDASKNQS